MFIAGVRDGYMFLYRVVDRDIWSSRPRGGISAYGNFLVIDDVTGNWALYDNRFCESIPKYLDEDVIQLNFLGHYEGNLQEGALATRTNQIVYSPRCDVTQPHLNENAYAPAGP